MAVNFTFDDINLNCDTFVGDVTQGTGSIDFNALASAPANASFKIKDFLIIQANGWWNASINITGVLFNNLSSKADISVKFTDRKGYYFTVGVQFMAYNNVRGFFEGTGWSRQYTNYITVVDGTLIIPVTIQALWRQDTSINVGSCYGYFQSEYKYYSAIPQSYVGNWVSCTVSIIDNSITGGRVGARITDFTSNFTENRGVTTLQNTMVFPVLTPFTGTFSPYVPGGIGPSKFFFYCNSLTTGTSESLNSINPDNIDGSGLKANIGSAALVKDNTQTNKIALYILKSTNNPVQSAPNIIVPLSGGKYYWELTTNNFGTSGFKTQLAISNVEYNVERTVNLGSIQLLTSVISFISNGKVATDNYIIIADYVGNNIKITKTTAGTDTNLLINVYSVI